MKANFIGLAHLSSAFTAFLQLCLIVAAISSPAQAQVFHCPKQASSDACGQCEPKMVEVVRKFVLDIRDGKRTYPTGEQFLDALYGALPVLFDNYVIMEKSDSEQHSSPGNPRILLKTPDSEVLLGFGTDPYVTGYDRMEVVLWNGGKGEWEYYDVHFVEDMTFSERVSYLEANHWDRSPKVTAQPQLCAKCHAKFGGDYKPNWDAYYLWAGQLPMRQDLLVSGTDEMQRYEDFYRYTLPRSARMKHLRVPNDVRDFLSTREWKDNNNWPGPRHGHGAKYFDPFNAPIIHRIDHQGGQRFTLDNSGPGTIMFNQLEAMNICRIENKVIHSKAGTKDLYPIVKYAAAGALEPLGGKFGNAEKSAGCQNFEDFFPSWFTDKAISHFSKSQQWITEKKLPLPPIGGSDFKTLYSSLRANTKARQDFHFKDKLERVMKAWEEVSTNLKTDSDRRHEFDRFEEVVGILDRETTLGYVTKLRLFLEPLKIDLRNWSLSNVSDTMTFGDFFVNQQFKDAEIYRTVHAEYEQAANAVRSKGLAATDFCKWSAAKSREAFGQTPIEFEVDPSSASADSDGSTSISIAPVDLVGYKLPSSCIACHTSLGGAAADRTEVPYVIPGPQFPFQNESALRTLVRGPEGKAFIQKMIDRVSRQDSEPGRMPFPPAKALSPRDRALMKAYLESLGN